VGLDVPTPLLTREIRRLIPKEENPPLAIRSAVGKTQVARLKKASDNP
jgi:hypothetical protein